MSVPAASVTVPVPVPAAAISPAIARACSAFLAALPDALDIGVTRRPTTTPERTAAWGEPTVTLVCASPAADPDAPPLIVDGEAFSTARLSSRVVWTTRDRSPAVRLDIPLAYESQADIVLSLIPALRTLPAA